MPDKIGFDRVILFENFPIVNPGFNSTRELNEYLKSYCERVQSDIAGFAEHYRLKNELDKSCSLTVIIRGDRVIGQFVKYL